jgi:hypothetical protein
VVTSSSAQTRLGGQLYCDEHHCISIYGNAILTYSTDPPNPVYLQHWTRATERLVDKTSGSISVVTLIDSRSRAPDELSKRAIRATIGKHSQHIANFAYVVEGTGFGAAAMRSALSLISLAARYPFPQRVFSSLEAAAPWILNTADAPRLGMGPTSLIAAAELMRGQVRQLAAAG